MKNLKTKKSFFILTMFISMLFFNSCNSSEKGKWSDADKEKFEKEMEKVDLSSLGKNKEKFLECYLEKVQAKYASFTEADADVEGCKALAKECSDEVLTNGSVKGKWSAVDKETFMAEMDKIDLSSLGDNKDAFLDCYLNKLEQNYSSFVDANSDETGCSQIAQDCAAGVQE